VTSRRSVRADPRPPAPRGASVPASRTASGREREDVRVPRRPRPPPTPSSSVRRYAGGSVDAQTNLDGPAVARRSTARSYATVASKGSSGKASADAIAGRLPRGAGRRALRLVRRRCESVRLADRRELEERTPGLRHVARLDGATQDHPRGGRDDARLREPRLGHRERRLGLHVDPRPPRARPAPAARSGRGRPCAD
jgi:hypothetical protein